VFKQYVREEYDNYALHADGTAPSRQLLAKWVVAAWGRISPALIVKAFVSTGITTPADYAGTEFADILARHRSNFVGSSIQEAVVGEANEQVLLEALEEAEDEDDDLGEEDDSGSESEDEDADGAINEALALETYHSCSKQMEAEALRILPPPAPETDLTGRRILFRWSIGWYFGIVQKKMRCS